jgi:hypothetical protein
MDDNPTNRQSPMWTIAVVLLVLLTAYVLLSGPMWVLARDYNFMGTYRLVYAPLFWLMQYVEPIKRIWISYTNLWTHLL